MRITVTNGVGEGPTPLAAFDAALLEAGLANYNLIYLSSVIPMGSSVERARFVASPDEYGHRLYLVIARHDKQQLGQAAWAGLGWTQDQTGCGLFVEQHGPDKAKVQDAILMTLAAMIAGRRHPYGPIQDEIVGITCREQPVCALVAAVYQSEGWK